MLAVTLERFGAPLALRFDAAVPEPGEGEALVAVEAAGVCGTDVKLWRGDLPGTPLPLVPGHENAGVVVETGPGCRTLSRGTRVVAFHHLFCGSCDRCSVGHENLCRRLRGRIGFDHDGGWAEYFVAPERNLFRVPDGVGPAAACVIPDAVATAWRAVVSLGEVRAGEHAAVVGAGGLGLAACQIAASRGAEVLAVDVAPEKLARAARHGASLTALAEQAPEVAAALPDGGADLVVDSAGTRGSLALGVRLLVPGGRLVQVGYTPGGALDLPSADVALKELRILGCRASSRRDLAAALEAVALGRVTPVVGATRPLEEAQAALDALAAGTVTGRQVLVTARAAPAS